MNGFKALGYSFVVIASVLLIFGFYSGWTSQMSFLHMLSIQGGTVEPEHYWYNFWYPFTPFAFQAVAFYAIGGVGVYYGRRQQKIISQQQTVAPQNATGKNESPTGLFFAYCPFCGKELPKGNHSMCPFCQKSFDTFHA